MCSVWCVWGGGMEQGRLLQRQVQHGEGEGQDWGWGALLWGA